MKMQFEVSECALPEDWVTPKKWPKPGVYRVPSEEGRLYVIGDWGVDVIFHIQHFTEVEDQGESVSEALLLKAIAAASRAEVLK